MQLLQGKAKDRGGKGAVMRFCFHPPSPPRVDENKNFPKHGPASEIANALSLIVLRGTTVAINVIIITISMQSSRLQAAAAPPLANLQRMDSFSSVRKPVRNERFSRQRAKLSPISPVPLVTKSFHHGLKTYRIRLGWFCSGRSAEAAIRLEL